MKEKGKSKQTKIKYIQFLFDCEITGRKLNDRANERASNWGRGRVKGDTTPFKIHILPAECTSPKYGKYKITKLTNDTRIKCGALFNNGAIKK